MLSGVPTAAPPLGGAEELSSCFIIYFSPSSTITPKFKPAVTSVLSVLQKGAKRQDAVNSNCSVIIPLLSIFQVPAWQLACSALWGHLVI